MKVHLEMAGVKEIEGSRLGSCRVVQCRAEARLIQLPMRSWPSNECEWNSVVPTGLAHLSHSTQRLRVCVRTSVVPTGLGHSSHSTQLLPRWAKLGHSSGAGYWRFSFQLS